MNKISSKKDTDLFLKLIDFSSSLIIKNDKLALAGETLESTTLGQKLVICYKGIYEATDLELTNYSLSINDEVKFWIEGRDLFESSEDINLYYVEFKKGEYYTIADFHKIYYNLSSSITDIASLKESIKHAIWSGYKVGYKVPYSTHLSNPTNELYIASDGKLLSIFNSYRTYFINSEHKEKNKYFTSTVLNFIESHSQEFSGEDPVELYNRLLIQCRASTEKGIMLYSNIVMVDDEPTELLTSSVLNNFLHEYEIAKENFMNNVYNDFFEIYPNYINYTNMIVVFYAIKRMINSDIKIVNDIDFFDGRAIKNMFASYGIFNLDDLPEDYAKVLLKNLVKFFNMRGSNGVMEEIVDIFDIDNINLERYLLVKMNKDDFQDEKYRIYRKNELNAMTLDVLEAIALSKRPGEKFVSLVPYNELVETEVINSITNRINAMTEISELDDYFQGALLETYIPKHQEEIRITSTKKYKLQFLIKEIKKYITTTIDSFDELQMRNLLDDFDTNTNESESDLIGYLKALYITARISLLTSAQLNEDLFNIVKTNDAVSSIDKITESIKYQVLQINKSFENLNASSLNQIIANNLEPVFNDGTFAYPYMEIKSFLFEKLVIYYSGLVDKCNTIESMKILYNKTGLSKFKEDLLHLKETYSDDATILTNLKIIFLNYIRTIYKDPTDGIDTEIVVLKSDIIEPDPDVISLLPPMLTDLELEKNSIDLDTNGMSIKKPNKDLYKDIMLSFKQQYDVDFEIKYHLVNLDTQIDEPLTTLNEKTLSDDFLPLSKGRWKLYVRATTFSEEYSDSKIKQYAFNIYEGILLEPKINLMSDFYKSPQTLIIERPINAPADSQILYRLNDNTGLSTYTTPISIGFGSYKITTRLVAQLYKDSKTLISNVLIENRSLDSPDIILRKRSDGTIAKSNTVGNSTFYTDDLEVEFVHSDPNATINYIVGSIAQVNGMGEINSNNSKAYSPSDKPVLATGGNDYLIKAYATRNGYDDSLPVSSEEIIVTGKIAVNDVKITEIIYTRPGYSDKHYVENSISALVSTGVGAVSYYKLSENMKEGSESELHFKVKGGTGAAKYYVKLQGPFIITKSDTQYHNKTLQFIYKSMNKDKGWKDSDVIEKFIDPTVFTLDYGNTSFPIISGTPDIPNAVRQTFSEVPNVSIRMDSRAIVDNIYLSSQRVKLTVPELPENTSAQAIYYRIYNIDDDIPNKSEIESNSDLQKTFIEHTAVAEIVIHASSMILAYTISEGKINLTQREIKIKIPRIRIAPKNYRQNNRVEIVATNELVPSQHFDIYYTYCNSRDIPEDPTVKNATLYNGSFSFYESVNIKFKAIANDPNRLIDGDIIYKQYEVTASTTSEVQNIINGITLKMSDKLNEVSSFVENKKVVISSEFDKLLTMVNKEIDVFNSKKDDAKKLLDSTKLELTANYLNSQYIAKLKDALAASKLNYKDEYSSFLIELYKNKLTEFVETDSEVMIRQRLSTTLEDIDDKILLWLKNKYIDMTTTVFANKEYVNKIADFNDDITFTTNHLLFSRNMILTRVTELFNTKRWTLLQYLMKYENPNNVTLDGEPDIFKLYAKYFGIMSDLLNPPAASSSLGLGTELDPYIIMNLEDFANISVSPGAYYKLGANIDLNYTSPLDGVTFSGKFDGDGYTISNFYKEYTVGGTIFNGIFPVCSGYVGCIENLRINNAHIVSKGNSTSGYHYTGIITGKGVDFYLRNIVIENSSITADDAATSQSGGHIGGLVGQSGTGAAGGLSRLIDDIYIANTVTVSTKFISGGQVPMVGGIAGSNYSGWGLSTGIRRVYVAANVGVAGAYGNSSCGITSSARHWVYEDCIIRVNLINGSINGLATTYDTPSMRRVYSVITSDSGTPNAFGDYVKTPSDGPSCYVDTQLNPVVVKETNVNSKTTLEMKTQSTYLDTDGVTPWDFTTTWGINPLVNNGYPYLRKVKEYNWQPKDMILLEYARWGMLIEDILSKNPNPNDSKTLKFLRSPYLNTNFEETIRNSKPSNYVDFNIFTQNDPMWKATETETIRSEFNYTTTKYIGIEISDRKLTTEHDYVMLQGVLDYLIRTSINTFNVNDSIINFTTVDGENIPEPVALLDIFIGMRILMNHYINEDSSNVPLTINDKVSANLISNIIADYLVHTELYDMDETYGMFPKNDDNSDSVLTFPHVDLGNSANGSIEDFTDWFNNIMTEKRRLENSLINVNNHQEYVDALAEITTRYYSVPNSSRYSTYANYFAYMSAKGGYEEYTNYLFGTINSDGIDVSDDTEKLILMKKKKIIYLADLARTYVNDNKFDDLFQDPNLLDLFRALIFKILNIFKSFSTDIVFDSVRLVSDGVLDGHVKLIDDSVAVENSIEKDNVGIQQNNNGVIIVDDFVITDIIEAEV